MAAKSAEVRIVETIRRITSDSSRVVPTAQAKSDMLVYRLTTDDVCEKIIEWIDAGEQLKPTTIHSFPGLVGSVAYVMKPRINEILFYIKMVIAEPGTSNNEEQILLLSVHPDH